MASVDLSGKGSITRSQMFDLVWSHTMRNLGAAAGLSDVLLYRLCKLWQIPYPSKAQRGKLMASRKVERPSLPEAPGGAADPIVLREGEDRFHSTFPVKPRSLREKPKSGDLWLERWMAEREAEKQAEEQANLARIKSPRLTYLYKIERWWPRYKYEIDPIGRDVPEEGFVIFLDGSLILPKKKAGKQATIEISFFGVGEYDDTQSRRSVGWSEIGGVHVVLHAPRSSGAGLIEILCAGRFGYLKTQVFAVPRHRLEEIELFELMARLEEEDCL